MTPAQNKVVDLMKNGWQLGLNETWSGHRYATIQQKGLGKGGTLKKVNKRTFDALVRDGVIRADDEQSVFSNPRRYVLLHVAASGNKGDEHGRI